MFPVLRVIGNGFRAAGTSEDGAAPFRPSWRSAPASPPRPTWATTRSEEGYATLARVTAEADVPGARRARCDVAEPFPLHGRARGVAAWPHRSGQHRQAALRHRQAGGRRLDPGLHRAAALARLSQRRRQRPVVHRAGGVAEASSSYHRAGIQLHIHTNGDEATELALDAIEAAQIAHAAARSSPHAAALPDGRRGAVPADEERSASAPICSPTTSTTGATRTTTLTMGPERAERLDATGTALRLGVPLRDPFRRADHRRWHRCSRRGARSTASPRPATCSAANRAHLGGAGACARSRSARPTR